VTKLTFFFKLMLRMSETSFIEVAIDEHSFDFAISNIVVILVFVTVVLIDELDQIFLCNAYLNSVHLT